MTDCTHPIEKISTVDGDGCVRFGEELLVWGECECGCPTIIAATIEDVERDAKGTTLHLEEYAKR